MINFKSIKLTRLFMRLVMILFDIIVALFISKGISGSSKKSRTKYAR